MPTIAPESDPTAPAQLVLVVPFMHETVDAEGDKETVGRGLALTRRERDGVADRERVPLRVLLRDGEASSLLEALCDDEGEDDALPLALLLSLWLWL